MYGGTINGGTHRAAVRMGATAIKENGEKRICKFDMYGGTINGGAGQAALETITNVGGKDCFVNIYGGTINGNEANDSVAIRLSTAYSDLKIYGGTINGKAGNCAGPAIRTEVASKITIAGGTINGSTTTSTGGAIYINAAATLNINGGTIQSPYSAIRQFLNGTDATNILTVNGGKIIGTNKAIWMKDPSKNANSGTLTVGPNAMVFGDVYLTVTEGSTEWPVDVAIAVSALKTGEVLTTNVPKAYDVKEISGIAKVVPHTHVAGTVVVENNKAPDCVNAGSYDNVV
jgi:hypothetical protein